MANIFKISDEFLTLIAQAEEAEGVLTEELEQALLIKEEDLLQKASNYVGVIKTKEGTLDMIDKEIKRLQAIKKREENTLKWLKNNLEFAVKTFGEINTGNDVLKLRKSSAVEVDDVNALPKEYKKIKITETADKTAIKKAIQAGETIEGCRIIQNENLKIN